MHGKPVRIQRDLVFDTNMDDMFVFCLPEAGRRGLLSVAERLLWAATWTNEQGQRVPINDAQTSVIEQTIAELCEGINMNDLVEAIEQLTSVIASKPSPSASATATCSNCGGDSMCCNCGCNGGNQTANQKTIQEVYGELSKSDIEWLYDILCSVDEQPEDDYKCRAANWIVDEWLGTNEELRENNDIGGLVGAVVTLIMEAREWVVKGQAVLIAVISWIINYFTDSLANSYQNGIIINRQVMVNAMYSATSPQASRDAVWAIVGNFNLPVVVKEYFRIYNYTATNWNILYVDSGVVPDDYPITTPCTYTPITPDPPQGYQLVPLPVAYLGESNGMTLTTENNIADYSWDNTSSGFNPAGNVTATLPVGSVGYMMQIQNYTANFADHASIGYENNAGETINGLSVDMLSLTSATFDVRGRLSSLSDLYVDAWLSEGTLQDVGMRDFRSRFNFAAARASATPIIGSFKCVYWALVPE